MREKLISPLISSLYIHIQRKAAGIRTPREQDGCGGGQDKASILDVKGIGGKRKRWEKKRQVPGVPDKKKRKAERCKEKEESSQERKN